MNAKIYRPGIVKRKRKARKYDVFCRRIEFKYNRTFSLIPQLYDLLVRLANFHLNSQNLRPAPHRGSCFLVVAINTRCLDESMSAGTRGCQAVVIRPPRDRSPIIGRSNDHRHPTYNSTDTRER